MIQAHNEHSPSLATGPEAAAATIPELVFAAAERHPSRIALQSDIGTVTYRELAHQSSTVTANLRALGIGPGAVIPVLAQRSLELPAILLGILQTGAAYTVLDVRWPVERLTELMGELDSSIRVIDSRIDSTSVPALTPAMAFADLFRLDADINHDEPPQFQQPLIDTDATAIVFWTSGSTGEPKAVATPHAAVSRLVAPPGCIPFDNPSTMIAAAAVPWDAFALELWGMLMTGGTAIMHRDDILLPHTIRHYIDDFGATHLFLTSTLFDVIAAAQPECFKGLHVLTVGGEKLNSSSCARVLATAPDLSLFNGYGPVESCVFATTHHVSSSELINATDVPIGHPVPGTQVLVCNDGNIVPRGTTGEILIAGPGLAEGYLYREDLTREAFVPVMTAQGELRCYRTGDVGRMDEDGTLHCLGRKDDQFKIAGHRIEPREIEQIAYDCGAKQCLALKANSASNPIVVLFVSGTKTDPTVGLQAAFARHLPTYMRPTGIHLLESFPMTSNQKVDKKALLATHGYQA